MSDGDRLRWRCRRGMRELDVLLTRYLDQFYSDASSDEQAAFRRLLDAPDPELFALLLGRTEAADDLEQDVVRRLRRGN